jgi:hypothetical protein
MADIVRIDGLDRLISRVDKSAANFKPTMTKGMNAAIKHVHDQIPGYPPAPAASAYVRTMQLGRLMNTKVEEIGGQVAGVIGDPVEYAPWVISDTEVAGVGPQTTVHQRNGWWLLQEEVEKSMPEVLRILGSTLLGLIS